MSSSFFENAKRTTIRAIYSSPRLKNELVLKGGNLLSLVFGVITRASIDLDFSIEAELAVAEIAGELNLVLDQEFAKQAYRVIDLNVVEVPPMVSDDLKDFWGGYQIRFKLVDAQTWLAHQDDPAGLRRNARRLLPNGSPTFKIDISKYEYCSGKESFVMEGVEGFGYSPEMMICEKLRAVCQQMPSYRQLVRKHLAGRARDFVDICDLAEQYHVNFANAEFRHTLQRVFQVKRVPLLLLREIEGHSEDHRADFAEIVSTVSAGVVLQSFDYYVDYVVRRCRELEPLGDE